MMMKSILGVTFSFLLLMIAQISFAKETVIITKEDLLSEGFVDDNYLDCGDPEEVINKFSNVYVETDKRYVYIVTEGMNTTVKDWSLRYRLLHAKKAYRDLDRYFSILMPSNWDNDSTNNIAVVVYYPDFPTLQELYEARDTCADLTGKNRCNHMIFYDKINTYCFPNISRYGPTIFDIFQYLQEQD